MNVRKWGISCLLALTAWSLMPAPSEAQLFGRGYGRRGVGVGVGYGSGGYGYNGYGYGSGWGNPGYFGGGWGPGISVGLGNRYSYPGYYNSSSVVGYNQPLYNGSSSSYQSFYPSTIDGGVAQSYDPCCCGGGSVQTAGTNQGSSTLVVNVPENAQLLWNGVTPMVGNGGSRRFTMQADGRTQRIEARWTGADGKTVTQSRDVVARPNDTVTIDFINGTNGTNGANGNGATDGQINQATPPNNPQPN